MGAPADRALTLADVKIKAVTVRSPWERAAVEEADTRSLAVLLSRPGGFDGLWYDLRGFVEILKNLGDHDDTTALTLGQLRAVEAGLRAILEEINPGRASESAASECTVEIIPRAKTPTAPPPAREGAPRRLLVVKAPATTVEGA